MDCACPHDAHAIDGATNNPCEPAASRRRGSNVTTVAMDRRRFLTTAGAAVAAATVRDGRAQQPPPAQARFRTGLVAYSYRQALQAKTMTYEDLIRIAVETGTD